MGSSLKTASKKILHKHLDPKWEALPADTADTCDRADFGWTKKLDSKERCGKLATWIKHQNCNCGKKDMTRRVCDAHRIEGLEIDLESAREEISKLIKLARRLNHDFTSNEEVELASLRMAKYPPPKPDEVYRRQWNRAIKALSEEIKEMALKPHRTDHA